MPPSASDKPWWSMTETCAHCGGGDSESVGRRIMVLCSACFARGTHAGCHEDVAGEELSPEITHGDGLYFCGKECQRSHEAIEAATGRRVRIRDEPEQYTFELVQYKNDDRAVRSAVETAMRMFRSSFAPLIMENGRDLLEMVCTSYETPDEEVDAEGGGHNFSAFRLAILRMGGTIITAATLRVFGGKFAEMPFVSTRQGHRRSGHCKRLMKAVEELLLTGGVHCLVIPSINELLPMWTEKFNFGRLAPAEVEGIEDWIVDTDRDTCTLVKKYIPPPGQPQPQRRQLRPPPPQQQAALPPPRPEGPCSIKSSSPYGGSSAGATNAPCNAAAGVKALRKRGRAPKIVLSKSLRKDHRSCDEDSDIEGSSGESDENGSGGKRRRAGRPRDRSRGHSRGPRGVTRSDSESDFVPTNEGNAESDGGGSGSGTDLVSETPLVKGSIAGKRARAKMAATAAATSSKCSEGSKAAEADGSAAAPAKPKRTRRVGPRAPRQALAVAWQPSEPLPAHPIYGKEVSVMKIPAELPPAPPKMPPEVDLGRPGLPNKPFELSIHLQSFLIRKAERAAAMAATAAAPAGGGDAAGFAGQPNAGAAVAGAVVAPSVPTATADPVAAAPAVSAAAVVQPTPRHQFPPPRPPLQQPLPQQHPQQQNPRRRRKRARHSEQGQQPQQQTRRHRGRRTPRSPAQEAARQRRLRIQLAVRQRRREYRELMMSFVVAEMVQLELPREEDQRVSEPLALMPWQNDPRDDELARLRLQYDALQRSHRALELQLAAAKSALRQAQQKQRPEQLQLPLLLAAPPLDCSSEPMDPDLAGEISLPEPEPEPEPDSELACEAAAVPTPLAIRTHLLSCATTPAAVNHRLSSASPHPSVPSSTASYAAKEWFDIAARDQRNERACDAAGGQSEPRAVSPTSTHPGIVGAAGISKDNGAASAAGSPCACGGGRSVEQPSRRSISEDGFRLLAGCGEEDGEHAEMSNPSEHASRAEYMPHECIDLRVTLAKSRCGSQQEIQLENSSCQSMKMPAIAASATTVIAASNITAAATLAASPPAPDRQLWSFNHEGAPMAVVQFPPLPDRSFGAGRTEEAATCGHTDGGRAPTDGQTARAAPATSLAIEGALESIRDEVDVGPGAGFRVNRAVCPTPLDRVILAATEEEGFLPRELKHPGVLDPVKLMDSIKRTDASVSAPASELPSRLLTTPAAVATQTSTAVGAEGTPSGSIAAPKPQVLVAPASGAIGLVSGAAESASSIFSAAVTVAVDQLRDQCLGGSADNAEDGHGLATAFDGDVIQKDNYACGDAAHVPQLDARSPSVMPRAALADITRAAPVLGAEPVETTTDVVKELGHAGPVAAVGQLMEPFSGCSCSHGLIYGGLGASGAVATLCTAGYNKESEVPAVGHKATEEHSATRIVAVSATQKSVLSSGLQCGTPPGPTVKTVSSPTLKTTMADVSAATVASAAPSVSASHPATAAIADGEKVIQPQACLVPCSVTHADPSVNSPAVGGGIGESGGGSDGGSPVTPPLSLADISRHIRHALSRSGALAEGSPSSPCAIALEPASDGGRDATTAAVAAIRDGAESSAGAGSDCGGGNQHDGAAIRNSDSSGMLQTQDASAMLSIAALRLSTDTSLPRGWGPRTGGILADRLAAASPPRGHELWMSKDASSGCVGNVGIFSPISGCVNNGTATLRAVNSDRSKPLRAIPWGSSNDDDGSGSVSGGARTNRSCSRKRRIIMLAPKSGNNSSDSVLKRQSAGSSTSSSGHTVADAVSGSGADTAPGAVKGATTLTGRLLGAAESAAVEQLSAMAATTTGCFAAVATAAAAAAAAVAVATATPSSPDADGARPPRPPVQEPLAETVVGLAAGERNPVVAAASPLRVMSCGPQPLASGAGTGASGVLGGPAGGPCDGGRNAPSSFIASPVSLRRFELTCLNPLLPHVVAVLLADTPRSRSPQLHDSGWRQRCLVAADGTPGAGDAVEGDADLSAGASDTVGKTAAEGEDGSRDDDGGGGRPGMRAALWETFEACARKGIIDAVQAGVGPADSYTVPRLEGEDGSGATFLDMQATINGPERMHVPRMAMATSGVAAGSKFILSAAAAAFADATDFKINCGGANNFCSLSKMHPPPDEPDVGANDAAGAAAAAAATAAAAAGGSKRIPDLEPAINVACATETCDGKNNPATITERGLLGAKTPLVLQQLAQARVRSPVDSCVATTKPYGRLVAGAPGFGPMLTVAHSSGSSSPALTKPRGRLVVLAPPNGPGSNSARKYNIADPYEAVLVDDEAIIGRGDHEPRTSTPTASPVASAAAAAAMPLPTVASKAGDPERTPSASTNVDDTTRATPREATFSGSPSDAPSPGLWRHRARITRRKKTMVDWFGEYVALSGSAPSDSPESTRPDSTPQTPRSDKQAEGMGGLSIRSAADRAATLTVVGPQGLGLEPVTKRAGRAAEGGSCGGAAAVAGVMSASGAASAAGFGAGVGAGNIAATGSPSPAPKSHTDAAMASMEEECLGLGAYSKPSVVARGKSVAQHGSKATAGNSGIAGGVAVVLSPGTKSVTMAAAARETAAIDATATQRSAQELKMAIQPRTTAAPARSAEAATPRHPFRPNVAVGPSDGVETAEAATAEKPLLVWQTTGTPEEVLLDLDGDGEDGGVSVGRGEIAGHGGCSHAHIRGGLNYSHGSSGILANPVSSSTYLDESLRSLFRTSDSDMTTDKHEEIATCVFGGRYATTAAAFDNGGGDGEASQAGRDQQPSGAASARNNNAQEPLRRSLSRYQSPYVILEPVSPPKPKQPVLMAPAVQTELHSCIAKGVLAGPPGGSSFLEGLDLLGSEGPTREDVDMAHKSVSALIDMLVPED